MGIDRVNLPVFSLKKVRTIGLQSALLSCGAGLLVCSQGLTFDARAQVNSTNDSAIGNNSNQNNVNQNANQNQNIVNNPDRIVYPLDGNFYTPVNTENDFGFNFSAGVNTLDSSNVTLYVGVIFQPGRTADHKARMNRLRKETEILEVQKKTLEARLLLLEKQVKDAGLQLEKSNDPVPDPAADPAPPPKAQGL
ncbi:hypothetical protein [Altericista sp. CCNU0014]|uniref:hypothetical protein n=1 Tax=Altericista sp. CCNU0014 TaxID=3082949 RepID=UPI00384C639E